MNAFVPVIQLAALVTAAVLVVAAAVGFIRTRREKRDSE